MNTTYTFKLDKKVRDDAKKVADTMGVPLSTVANAMFKQFIRDRTLVLDADCPYPSHTPNAETRRAICDIEKRKNLISFDSIADFEKYVRAI